MSSISFTLLLSPPRLRHVSGAAEREPRMRTTRRKTVLSNSGAAQVRDAAEVGVLKSRPSSTGIGQLGRIQKQSGEHER